MQIKSGSLDSRKTKGGPLIKKTTKDKLFALALLTPSIIVTVMFILVPVFDSVIKSFQNYKIKNIIAKIPGEWNNFDNYVKLFSNNKLLPSIQLTLIFVGGVVLSQFILGMAMALVLNSNLKGARFIRSVMMAPWIVPTIISGLIWMWIYQPQYGLLKYVVNIFSFGNVSDFAMLNNPATALLGIAIAALWKQIPLTALLLVSGLANVPEETMEAATVDGANAVDRFFHITIPYMKSVIKVTASMAIIENFKQFPLIWTMTGGGPNNSTSTLAILSYREAFVSNNLGSGAAVTTVWMLLMIVVVVLFNFVFKDTNVD
ncbi:multiple sugar transport system permease protein [Mobilisporobacter senegalensis]|uniref:Multiple sugar transport system permease protein n=1 Tax=Mobilisporobacter senegalensis TaxID=1329262 RepID=A0A3N1XEY5_9FIRM|nr:sugar ABC transporter permease [Mobilisporobacter senegalensis]ROR25290.1 multiple sugar transport system permease protein [Mobilisporobacter senegalensis]